jgi:hypothetical protein
MDNTALPVTKQSTGVGYYDYFDDILWNAEGNNDSPLSMVSTTAAGSTAALEVTAPTDNTYAGRYDIATGPTNNATGKATLSSSGGTNRIKAGGSAMTIEWRVRMSALSGTPQFNIKLGLQDGTALGDPANGIYLYYSSTINSGNWRGVTRNASTSTNVDSSIAATTNWVKLRLQVNSAGTSVEFFVDDVSIGTSSTNIPTGNAMRIMASIEKQGTASTTSRTLNLDYIYYRMVR